MNQAIILSEDGQRLGPNQVGEMCFSPEVSFVGYFEDAKSTNEAFHEGKYFKTGDLGYFDEDCFLFYIDRKKEALHCGGFEVMPAEVENHINSMKGVKSSCVVGILDEKTGNDILFAFVLRNTGEAHPISEEDIIDHVDSKVIDAKKIRGGVIFIEKFPMTPTGKVKKMELKKIVEKKLEYNSTRFNN